VTYRPASGPGVLSTTTGAAGDLFDLGSVVGFNDPPILNTDNKRPELAIIRGRLPTELLPGARIFSKISEAA